MMGLFDYIITIYNSIVNIIEELTRDATIFVHRYAGLEEESSNI